jgi:hypothetical protein
MDNHGNNAHDVKLGNGLNYIHRLYFFKFSQRLKVRPCFLVVTPCSLAVRHQPFGGTRCLHPLGTKKIWLDTRLMSIYLGIIQREFVNTQTTRLRKKISISILRWTKYEEIPVVFRPLLELLPRLRSNEWKQQAVPLQAWSGPEGSRKLRFPDFMTTAQDGGKVVSPTHRPHVPPGNSHGTHFCSRLSRPQGHSAIRRIMSMRNSNDTI